MAYQFDFLSVLDYTDVLLKGIAVTAQLTLTGGVLGVAVAVAGAWAKTQGPAWLHTVVSAYVELIRNTPFLIQLFFIFFGLPSWACICPRCWRRRWPWSSTWAHTAPRSFAPGWPPPRAGSSRRRESGHVAVPGIPSRGAAPRVAEDLAGAVQQIVIVMLGSAVCSQIAAQDLTYAANFIQGRNFRAFEVYLVST
jgi:polar amino acid transport system permease protein